MYNPPMDAPKPQFVVVQIHSEYEESVNLFITENAAREFATEKKKQGETYLAQLLEL